MTGSHWLFSIAALAAATGLLFGLAPGLDLAVSHALGGRGFSLRTNDLALLLRQAGQLLPMLVVVACLLALLGPFFYPYRRCRFDARRLAAILLTFLIGPGLVVNVALKDHWHRPRPNQVIEFGGTSPFKPWWDSSGACETNCSFASGEVSAAAAAAFVVALIPAAYFGTALILAGVLTLIVAYLRLAFGGHFLSDVVFALLITQFIAVGFMTCFHAPSWRYGRPDMLERDIRLWAFRLRAHVPGLRGKPRWLAQAARFVPHRHGFSPTLGGAPVVGWERADEHGGLSISG